MILNSFFISFIFFFKLKYSLLDYALLSTYCNSALSFVIANMNVMSATSGLGMDIGKPDYRINSVYAYQYYTTNGYLLNNYNFSDRRLKKDIKNITSPLIQIKKLQGVSYHLNSNRSEER